jgi:hypothetical protein
MPKFTVLFLLTFLFISSQSGLAQDPGRHFYQDFKRTKGVMNLSLPGWLVWVGGGLAYNSVNDPEAKAILKLAKKLKRVRFLYSEEATHIPQAAWAGLNYQLDQSGYDPLLEIREGDTRVTVTGKTKGETFRRLIVLVRDGDEMVFLQAKSNIKIQHITRLIQELRALDKKEESDQKKKIKKIPQAT